MREPSGTILVITQLDNASHLLKPEMTGNAKIYCGEQRLLKLVSRRLVRLSGSSLVLVVSGRPKFCG